MKKTVSFLVSFILLFMLTVTVSSAECYMEDIEKHQAIDAVCSFSSDDFGNAYSNTESLPLSSIKIETLPPESDGTLKLSGNDVTEKMLITYDLLSELSFHPSEGFSGEVTFKISATDDKSVSDESTVKIIYSSSVSANVPITSPFSIVCDKNTEVYSKLVYQYSGSGELTYTIVSVPKKGEIKITSDEGDFSYTPFTDQTGTDSFSFRVNSPEGESNISTCSVAIQNKEQEPLPTSPSASFVYRDMVTHWGNYSAVNMTEAGIMKGERIGNKYYFYPDKVLTRLDCINYILASLYINSDDIPENMNIFADSDKYDDYVNLAAAKAYELGIINGSIGEDGQKYLNPFNPVQRVELIKMLDIAMGIKINSKKDIDFADKDIIPEWAYTHIQNVYGYGIIQGYDDNTLRPFSNVTKAEATEMLYQVVKYNSQESSPVKSTIARLAKMN